MTARPPVGLDALAGIHDLEVDADHVAFDVDTVHLDAAIARISQLGVVSLSCHPPTLEELFLRYYGDQLTDDATT